MRIVNLTRPLTDMLLASCITPVYPYWRYEPKHGAAVDIRCSGLVGLDDT